MCYNPTTMDDGSAVPLPQPDSSQAQRLTTKQRAGLVAGVIVVVALLAWAILAVLWMIRNPAQTETLRDVFIILMAVETLVIGVALIILIVQLARLTNLLQNEIKPILMSTQETVSTLRGTTRFLSDNLVAPVVKVNSSMAAVRRIFDLLHLGGRK